MPTEIMNFERLPNEILLDIFGYFTGIDLLRTFYDLNSRLNFLLHHRFQDCSFKFNAVSKRDFDMICQQHLPQMSDYIPSLHLSDHEETPTQIKLFLSYSPSFDRFTQLRSLSLSNLRSYQTLIKIMNQCHQLYHLTHLDFFHCFFQDDQVDFQWIVNHIWSLPKLIHCTIGIGIKGQGLFCTPTKISSTLQYISIENMPIKLNQINRLFECTPGLKCLSISVSSFIDNDYIPSPLPTLTDLSINSPFPCNASNMVNLLQNTPNLHCLNIDLSTEIVDGNQWEEIIRNHLPKLEVFQVKMKVVLPALQDIQGRVDTLINSFETPFWIDEHRWYVYCLTQDRTIYLYTLSNHYEDKLPVSFKSTSLEHDEHDFYSRMTKIKTKTFFDQPISSSVPMRKISYLHINLPISDQFWSIVPNFNRLKSLTIYFHANTFHLQVQALLDRATRLYSLSINQYRSIPLQTSIFKYRNASVRELDLRCINHYFNEDDCIQLSESPLGVQCEVLSILVYNCESIITLVKHMRQIRSLNVRCQNEQYTTFIDDNKDECIQWLQNHLPPTSVVVRDPKQTGDILIWI
jgi:hypothetical protein